jgi:uncharacterized membrane protein
MLAISLKKIWQIFSFIAIQYSLGRRGSFPYGLLLGLSLFEITTIVVISDIVQTILLLNFLVYTRQRFKSIYKKLKLDKNEANNENIIAVKKKEKQVQKRKKLTEWLEKNGSAGLIFIAALPYGGGALTGSIVAVSIKMNKKKAFFLIIIGCIISSFLYYLGFTGLLFFFK